MSSSVYRVVWGIILLPLMAISISSQTITGLIKGRVTDSSGAVVPGAKVRLTRPSSDESGNGIPEASTDVNGEFDFREVPFGSYIMRPKASWVAREFRKEVVLTSTHPTKIDLVISFEPCSDEKRGSSISKLSDTDLAEIVRFLVGTQIPASRRHDTPKVIFWPGFFPREWLTPEQLSRVSLMTRFEIQELTEKKGSQTYYWITKPIQKGACVSIALINSVTLPGELEDANMAGGQDLYEFRKINGKWEGQLLLRTIS